MSGRPPSPLRRLLPGHRVVYCSPSVTLGGNDRLRAFIALGTVMPQKPYQADMGDGLVPGRRDVAWLGSQPRSNRRQRLVQIGQQVVNVLNAHTQPHRVLGHAGFDQLFG